MRIILLILLFCPILPASVSYNYVYKKTNFYTFNGVVTGGDVKQRATLLGVRSKLNKNKTKEKWIFDLGNTDFKPLKNLSPYFSVSIDQKNHRIILEIQKTKLKQIDLVKIKKNIINSKLVKDIKQDFDLDGGGLIFYFTINKSVKMRAYPLINASKSTRIVVDLYKE